MSALSLHVQLETSNRFLEIANILQGGELECPDQPRPVAAVHRPRPGRAAPRLAAGPGSTERSACGIVTDLTTAGCAAKQKDGRRNRYQRLRPRTSRRSWRMIGTSSRMRPEAGKVIFEPGFVIRVRDHRPVTASPSGPPRRAQWRGSAGGAGCLPGRGRPVRGEARVVSGDSGCESGEEDAGTSVTLNRAACGPAWLAATDHRASPSSPGLGCCQAASAHAPVTWAAGGSRSRLCWAAVAGWLSGMAPQ